MRVWFVAVLAVQLSQRLELMHQGTVLTLEHHDTHLQTGNVFLFLPPTHTSRLSMHTPLIYCEAQTVNAQAQGDRRTPMFDSHFLC